MQNMTKRISWFEVAFVFYDNIISSNSTLCNELSILFLDYSAQFVDTNTVFSYNGLQGQRIQEDT